MKLYLKMLRWLWWNRGWDDLLSFSFLLLFLPVAAWLLVCVAETFYYTYLYLRKDEKIHSVFEEMIDRSGIWKCRLHDYQYSRESPCPRKVWSEA